jgi:hypothetical protein
MSLTEIGRRIKSVHPLIWGPVLVIGLSVWAFNSLDKSCSENYEQESVPEHASQGTNQYEDQSSGNHKTTKKSQSAVPKSDPVNSPQETQNNASQTNRKPKNWGKEFWCEVNAADGMIAIFTAILSIATIGLWAATHRLWESAKGQADDMKASIAEASRSAAAMEKVAESIAVSAGAATESVATSKEIAARQKLAVEMQMRAYLTVVIGGEAFYQERDKGIKFEARPLIVNSGHTPAREVTYRIKADILPVSLPPNYSFPIPEEIKGGSAIGPHQNATMMGAILDGFVADQDVADIRFATGQKAFYVWGVVNYVDAFNNKWETTFGQIIFWRRDGNVYGSYVRNHNDAT